MLVEHRLTERFPALVLLQLQVEAGQLPDQDLERALPRAPLTIRMLQTIKARQQLATELVHDQVAVALDHRHRPLHPAHDPPLRGQHAGESCKARDCWTFARNRIDQLLHRLLHVGPQPRMGRELPGMRHLVQDQPPPEVLFGEVGVALPLLDVCLDQIQALGSHWLRAQKLGVVLAEDATAHEGEHVAEVAVDSHPSDLDEQGVGHAAGFEDRVDDATQDAQVEVDPALAIEGLERRHRRASRQSADEAQQGLLEFVGQ